MLAKSELIETVETTFTFNETIASGQYIYKSKEVTLETELLTGGNYILTREYTDYSVQFDADPLSGQDYWPVSAQGNVFPYRNQLIPSSGGVIASQAPPPWLAVQRISTENTFVYLDELQIGSISFDDLTITATGSISMTTQIHKIKGKFLWQYNT